MSATVNRFRTFLIRRNLAFVLCFFLAATILFLFQNVVAASETEKNIPSSPKPIVADINAGEQLSAQCTACHGLQGNSAVPNFPKLAGQGVKYFIKQIQDIKSEKRPVPSMTAITASLSEQDILNLAAYFSQQSPTLQGADSELIAIGEKIYRGGLLEKGVPACASCHGANGEGMPKAGFPAVSGQHAQYTEAQLTAFRAAGREDIDAPNYRRNDAPGLMMQPIAAKLSDQEIKSIANYISGLY